MHNREPEPNKWRRIDTSSDYACGFVWTRLEWLIDYDPYLGMLNDNAKKGLVRLVVECIGNDNKSLRTTDIREIQAYVRDGLDRSAFGLMFSHQCLVQLMILVSTAITAGSVDNGPDLR